MKITIDPKRNIEEIKVLAKDVVQKHNIPPSQVVTAFDISGSMDQMYRSGIVDALATRVLGLGLQLDDNGIIPVYALSDDCKRLPDLKAGNLNGYVQKNLYSIIGGGTEYAPTLNEIVTDAKEGDPMLVIIFTDGENFDKAEAEEALIRSSQIPIFFQWYGIYQDYEPSFSFLHKMDDLHGRVVDNAGFSPLGIRINDTSSGDDQAFLEDMVKEYRNFPEKATRAGSTWANLDKVKQGGPPRRRLFGIF